MNLEQVVVEGNDEHQLGLHSSCIDEAVLGLTNLSLVASPGQETYQKPGGAIPKWSELTGKEVELSLSGEDGSGCCVHRIPDVAPSTAGSCSRLCPQPKEADLPKAVPPPWDSPRAMTGWCRDTKVCLYVGGVGGASEEPSQLHRSLQVQPRFYYNPITVQHLPLPSPASTPSRHGSIENFPANPLQINLCFSLSPKESGLRCETTLELQKGKNLGFMKLISPCCICISPYCWGGITSPFLNLQLFLPPSFPSPNSIQDPIQYFTDNISGSFQRFTFLYDVPLTLSYFMFSKQFILFALFYHRKHLRYLITMKTMNFQGC